MQLGSIRWYLDAHFYKMTHSKRTTANDSGFKKKAKLNQEKNSRAGFWQSLLWLCIYSLTAVLSHFLNALHTDRFCFIHLIFLNLTYLHIYPLKSYVICVSQCQELCPFYIRLNFNKRTRTKQFTDQLYFHLNIYIYKDNL